MKKLLVILFVLVSFTIFSCIVINTPIESMYLLNWGEYIDQDLIELFEDKYNCRVIEENVTSSETMYQKIVSKTTPYDVAIPGDYTVRQLYKEGLLKKIDVDNEEFTNLSNYETMFTDSLKTLMDENMIDNNSNPISTYYMPYFWGAYSIIYSTTKDDVESVIQSNGFKALFDRSLYNESVSIGMYDTARWIVASYLLANDYNPNITDYEGHIDNDLSLEIINDVKNALLTTNFNEFGNDQLKRKVANGSLDMCFAQLGDFFDALNLVYESNNPVINFNVAVPTNASAFFDSMVIPSTSKKSYLANAFINFMLDPNNAYQNANAIGYCPTLKAVCDLYNEDALNGAYYYEGDNEQDSLLLSDFLNKYPMYLNPLYNSTNASLFDPKSNEYLTTCNTIYNIIS